MCNKIHHDCGKEECPQCRHDSCRQKDGGNDDVVQLAILRIGQEWLCYSVPGHGVAVYLTQE
jgi:hypothetical protein